MTETMTEEELLRGLAPLTGEPFDELDYLIDRMRKGAVSVSDTSKLLAEMRNAEYRARGDGEPDYQWLKPEQTSEWKAAQAMERLRETNNRLRELIEAIDSGNLQMSSPEIGGHDDIPPHPWHEQWLHHARAALAQSRC